MCTRSMHYSLLFRGHKSLSQNHDILLNKVAGLLRNIIDIYGINRIIYSTNLLPYSLHHNPTQPRVRALWKVSNDTVWTLVFK